MNILNKIRLGSGLESHIGQEFPEPEVQHEQTESADLSAALLEVASADDVVDQYDESVNVGVDVVEGLEQYATMMAQAVGNRGLSPDTAHAVNVGISRELARLGVKHEYVGTEAYENAATRTSTTRAGLEDLKTTLKNIWAWILEKLEKAIKFGEDYYLRVFGAAAQLKRKVESVRSKANGMQAASKESGKLEVSASVVKVLHIDRKIPAKLSAHLKTVVDLAGDIFSAYGKAANEFAEDVMTQLEKVDFSDDTKYTNSLMSAKVTKPFPSLSLSGALPTGDSRFKKAGAGVTSSGQILGGQMIVQQNNIPAIPAGGNLDLSRDGVSAVLSAKTYMAAWSEKEQDIASQQFEILNIDEINEFCNSIEDIATLLDKYRRGASDNAKLKKKAATAAKSMRSQADRAKDLNAANTTGASHVVKLLTAIPQIVDQPNQKYAGYMLSVCNSVLSLCEQSLGKYKK